MPTALIGFMALGLLWGGIFLGESGEKFSWELHTRTTLDELKTQIKECEAPLPRTESCVLEIKAVKKGE